MHTSIDCSSFSQYHQCDPNDGECKPVCNVELCPDGKTECDPAIGCPCNDDNKCTIDSWDPVANTCIHEHISCHVNESCDSADG